MISSMDEEEEEIIKKCVGKIDDVILKMLLN